MLITCTLISNAKKCHGLVAFEISVFEFWVWVVVEEEFREASSLELAVLVGLS